MTKMRRDHTAATLVALAITSACTSSRQASEPVRSEPETPVPAWHDPPAHFGEIDGERAFFGHGRVDQTDNRVLGKVSAENKARGDLGQALDRFLIELREAYYASRVGESLHVVAPLPAIRAKIAWERGMDQYLFHDSTNTHYARAALRLSQLLAAVEKVDETEPEMQAYYAEHAAALFDRMRGVPAP